MSSLIFSNLNLSGSISVEPKEQGPSFNVVQKTTFASTIAAFGFSMASDSTNIIVGAYGGSKAYVYEYDSTTWNQTAEFVKTGYFGMKVAISGDWVAISNNPSSGNGTVYMYRKVGGIWETTEFMTINVPSDTTGSGFASSVALDGDTLVIGHRQANSVGGAHVYVWNGTTWARQGTLLSYAGTTRSGTNQNFGYSVSIKGDTLVIGGPGSNGLTGTGMALVSKRTSGTWSTPVPLQPSTTTTDGYGYSVKIKGTSVLISAPVGSNTTSNVFSGRLFLYDYSTSIPTLLKTFIVRTDGSELIQDSGMLYSDVFGWAIDMTDDETKILVSAPSRNSNRGAIYVYEKYNNDWGTSAISNGSKLIPDDVTTSSRFGSSGVFAQGGIMGGAYGTKKIYWFY
jgi:FG-GAP repeat